MLSVKNLYKSIPSGTLLEDITFTLGNKEKVGLIGQNGCGKSTLLKIVVGEEDYDQGFISLEAEKIAYLPQLFDLPVGTVNEFSKTIFPLKEHSHKYEKQLVRLGLDQTYWDVPLSNLSSGQKMRVKLAELLVSDPTILILDEPTNHLDIEGIQWIEAFVKAFDGIVLMVSHDRSFLDAVCTYIFEIDEKHLHIFPGNYTDYIDHKQMWLADREKTYKRQEKKREQLTKLLENARKVKDGKGRGKAVQAAKKRMEREVLKNEVSKYSRSVVEGITFEGTTHTGKLMLRVDQIAKHFGTKHVLGDVSFEIRGDERVWLYGANGQGKSTLLNIITGHLETSAGSVAIGESVKWGYFRQNQEHLPFEQTVRQFFQEQTGIGDQALFGVLKTYLFPKEYLERKIGSLSPGERARLGFAVFAQQKLDLLILDEPTNHLDIWTKEAIEASLRRFKGAILLVSHDRYFVKEVGIHTVYHIESGSVRKMVY